jgi:hypothetical protein
MNTINSEGLVNIADTFEHAINNLHTRSAFEQSVIAEKIANLEYIDLLIAKEGSKIVYEQLAKQIAGQIDNKTAIVDIMSISALYYKGKKAGFDVEVLHKAMNINGEWLMTEQLKSISKSH